MIHSIRVQGRSFRLPLPAYFSPPSFLRHFVPWKLLLWIDERADTCWAGMVMWKLGYEWQWGSPCVEDAEKDGACFCGKVFREGHFASEPRGDPSPSIPARLP